MQTSRRSVLKSLALVGTTATLGSAAFAGTAAAERTQWALVRVAHASPDAPNVDVYVNEQRVLADVPFKAVSDYLPLPVGTYTVKITAAGDEDTVAFNGDVTVERNVYTIAAIGELTEGTFRPLVLVDTLRRVRGKNARIRVVHASPDAPAVDVTVVDGAVTLFDGPAFGDVAEYIEVPAGSYDVQIRGDTAGNDGPVVGTFPVTLDRGDIYTVFAMGYLTPDDEPAANPFDLVVAVDRDARRPRRRPARRWLRRYQSDRKDDDDRDDKERDDHDEDDD
ncbi:DUF4397 domain-containing protein [Haladaptatus sp. DJG-WS-42]|uniref:DUF4397 domain-containing protein n=1 Tax=Haladaptatus sp. DJG-WS-42 TaxID=3120516 RepID=UPI0030CB1838